jgi:hypothetical protein
MKAPSHNCEGAFYDYSAKWYLWFLSTRSISAFTIREVKSRLSGVMDTFRSCFSTITSLPSSLLTGFPYDIRTVEYNNMPEFNVVFMKSQGMRRVGSSALDCCYVVNGRLGGYWEFGVIAYDVATDAFIIRRFFVLNSDCKCRIIYHVNEYVINSILTKGAENAIVFKTVTSSQKPPKTV